MNKELQELSTKFSLSFQPDFFGFGTRIFFQGLEIGFYFEWEKGIDLQFTQIFGCKSETHKSWESLCKSLDEKISSEVKNSQK